MPVNLKEIDEVWLALEESWAAFARNGHRPAPALLDCHDCYAMWLIENAKRVYLSRHQPASPAASQPDHGVGMHIS